MFANSPIEPFTFAGHEIFLKRDDLLHTAFSGNKARKFAYFLEHDLNGITKVIGHGSAQANSLYSLSALAKLKGWLCDFYVDHIADHILAQPTGNYGAAIANGTNIIDLRKRLKECFGEQTPTMRCEDYIQQHVLPLESKAFFIPEGGRCHYAEYGVNRLGEEIVAWANVNNIVNLKVFLPSGTGTTALFLNQYFMRKQTDIRVITCAVVGGDDYLKLQFAMLNPEASEHPRIMNVGKKYHFGKLYPEFYSMWQRICAAGIEFELLYDPLGFIVLEHYLQSEADSPILYIHQGGVLGNETMLPRYRRKFAVV